MGLILYTNLYEGLRAYGSPNPSLNGFRPTGLILNANLYKGLRTCGSPNPSLNGFRPMGLILNANLYEGLRACGSPNPSLNGFRPMGLILNTNLYEGLRTCGSPNPSLCGCPRGLFLSLDFYLFLGGNTVAIRSLTVLLPYCYRIASQEEGRVQNAKKRHKGMVSTI